MSSTFILLPIHRRSTWPDWQLLMSSFSSTLRLTTCLLRSSLPYNNLFRKKKDGSAYMQRFLLERICNQKTDTPGNGIGTCWVEQTIRRIRHYRMGLLKLK